MFIIFPDAFFPITRNADASGSFVLPVQKPNFAYILAFPTGGTWDKTRINRRSPLAGHHLHAMQIHVEQRLRKQTLHQSRHSLHVGVFLHILHTGAVPTEWPQGSLIICWSGIRRQSPRAGGDTIPRRAPYQLTATDRHPPDKSPQTNYS